MTRRPDAAVRRSPHLESLPEHGRDDMIRSMTGYSKVQAEEGGYSIAVSIRGTNHRFLDVQLRFPSVLESMDPLLRRLSRITSHGGMWK